MRVPEMLMPSTTHSHYAHRDCVPVRACICLPRSFGEIVTAGMCSTHIYPATASCIFVVMCSAAVQETIAAAGDGRESCCSWLLLPLSACDVYLSIALLIGCT